MELDPQNVRLAAAAALSAISLLAFGFFIGKRVGIRSAAPAGARRNRRPIFRAILLSLLFHAGLAALFSIYVISDAVYQSVKTAERQEVRLHSDALARERLALGIRESSPSLPPLSTPEPETEAAPPPERLPFPEIGMRELRAPLAAPAPVWNPAETAALASDDRFRPERIVAADIAAASPAVSAFKLDEPEPAVGELEKQEPVPPPAPPAVAAVLKPAPEMPRQLPQVTLPPITPAFAPDPESPPLQLERKPMELAALAPEPTRIEPELALETRPVTTERYLLREKDVRARALPELGGSPETEAAIERALRWLARHQEQDGRWKIDRFGGHAGHDVAATSLAVLAFLAWGTDPAAGDEFGKATRLGLDWLVARTADDGDLRHEPGRPSGNMYDQGMGGIALAEALALTGDSRFREPAQKAIRFIVAAQNKGDGGWRYQPGEGGDTSVFGWKVMALTSARLAGLEVPEESLANARRWLVQVGGGNSGGEYGYQDRSPKPAMVAEGMYSRQLLGPGPNQPLESSATPAMQESAAYLSKNLPNKDDRDYYFWYYGALALYQHQGPVWQEWNSRLRPILLESQRRDGDDDGSWDPNSRWGGQAGRAVITALAALTLEVYYRYLPLDQ